MFFPPFGGVWGCGTRQVLWTTITISESYEIWTCRVNEILVIRETIVSRLL